MKQIPKISTGALTKEEHQTQDKIYVAKHEYDYLIIGTGISALTLGCLLANAGYKVCMLEAHDAPGGYAHSFKMGDFHFCAEIHYIWGCAPGDSIYEFLKKIGLEKDITFLSFDPEGYDQMAMPDGKIVKIPYGFDKLADNIETAYPGHKQTVQKFLNIISKIHTEQRPLLFKQKINLIDKLKMIWTAPTIIKYRNKTVQEVFDQYKLPQKIQTVLIANAGDLGSPPNQLSILAYAGLMGGYNTGAYYPTRHFKYYTESLAKFITDHEGCHIFYETKANKINIEDDEVVGVETSDGKTFTAKNYICNADPQHTAKNLIGWEKFPKSFRPALSYSYVQSGIQIYLGLKDIDLRKHGLGSFNTWHHEQWDINKGYIDQMNDNFEKPWFFMSTATLHTNDRSVVPKGCDIMEIASFTNYDIFKKLKDKDPKLYRQKKEAIADLILDIIEKKYVPGLRQHIVLKVIGSPLTNEDYVNAPYGNSYGSEYIPKQMGLKRLKATTPWDNFYWCNASSGYAGVFGTTNTGMALYMKLTGDKFFDESKVPSDKELQDYARKNYKG